MKKYRLYRLTPDSGRCYRCGDDSFEFFVLAAGQGEVEKCKRERLVFCRDCLKNLIFELLQKGAYIIVER